MMMARGEPIATNNCIVSSAATVIFVYMLVMRAVQIMAMDWIWINKVRSDEVDGVDQM